jgi:hypothetical protein
VKRGNIVDLTGLKGKSQSYDTVLNSDPERSKNVTLFATVNRGAGNEQPLCN